MTHAVSTPAGLVSLTPLALNPDTVRTLHAWLSHPGSAYWGMRGLTPDQVGTFFADWLDSPHRQVHVVRIDGLRVGLAVYYDPARIELDGRYTHQTGDLGMHLLVAPSRTPVPGTTAAVIGAICETAFGPLEARRVVVEPDARNTAVHRLNARAGFLQDGLIELPDKTALLSFCSAEGFRSSEIGRDTRMVSSSHTSSSSHPSSSSRPSPGGSPSHAHLTGHAMRRAHRHLCAKALAEFSHERLITPAAATERDEFEVRAGDELWRFRARVLPLEHWVVDAGSIRREVDGRPVEPDAQALVIALAPVLGIPESLVGVYLEEIAATLGSAAFCLHHRDRPVQELAGADLQEVEGAMTEGHPGFVANNGRIGLGLTDRHRYTPEAPATVRLVWLAARRDLSHLATVAGLDEEDLYLREFGRAALDRCTERLRDLGLDPDGYRLLPVHPWQWEHKIAVAFGPDLARRDLVFLGESDDEYRPQQSVRTFFDVTHPERGYVKTALAVQNMGFTRGLSPRYMRDTPAVNEWVAGLVAEDPVLRALDFEILREVAAVGYTGDAYHRAARSGVSDEGPHTKMIAALWRESPVPRLAEDERAFTLASLLHVDLHGRPLVVEHLELSGSDARTWLRALLDAYVLPVARCLLTHGLVFMPHGENVIVVIGPDHVPRRVLFKDIGEEVAVITERPLPEGIDRIRHVVDAETAALSIHTDVMDGVLRHLAAILDEAGVLTASEFWDEVRSCLQTLAGGQKGPGEGDRDEIDGGEIDRDEIDADTWEALFAPRFRHSCLNRLQLRDTRQMVDLTDQAGSLQFAGTLTNPLALGDADAPSEPADREERPDHVARETRARITLVDDGVGSVS
ncbi:GNAT family N-acetyltransferase [Dietzia sp. PP-33]|jgi:siderophore synthetase component/RimJ/RimL family protein N-acetyltransferase|uniref:GNAT family N-acetyltransferase n=1 Tax=Dietzia sp. PP-33 TaxID=2957500 RepID=UPI0029BC3BE4|nr:GNAT family N-acetyltransferase [Dietzia sp. PP-33]MDX2357325.1 GNAT family N-acetyltransferase [Dietzia sp. PP-33]